MLGIFAIYFNGMLISKPKALNCLAHMIIDFSQLHSSVVPLGCV